MLPNIKNIEETTPISNIKQNQIEETYPTIKKIYKELVSSKQLDFEYLPSIGDLKLANKLFDLMFDNKVSVKSQIAMAQTCGLQNGYFIMGHIVKNYYINSNKFYVRKPYLQLKNLLKAYEFEYYDFNIQELSELHPSSVIIVNNPEKQDIENLNKNIKLINEKKIMLFICIDKLNTTDDYSFDMILYDNMVKFSELINELEAIVINMDMSSYLSIGGVNLGHLFIKVDTPDNARNCEGAISFFNRNTFSTPVKMGCTILARLLEDKNNLISLGKELNA